jgi:sterol desaturase/sphingolipid hydroxylase (fatty acid hydroxylase superfamily)
MVLCMDCHLVNIIFLVPNFHSIHHGMKNGSIVDVMVSSSNHIGEDVFSSHLIFLYPTYTCFVCVFNT